MQTQKAASAQGATILSPGGEIKNFGRTLRELNKLLQELFYKQDEHGCNKI